VSSNNIVTLEKSITSSPSQSSGGGGKMHRLCQSLQHHTLMISINAIISMTCMIMSDIWRHFAPSFMVVTTVANIWCVWFIVRKAQWFIDNCRWCFLCTRCCWILCIHNYNTFEEQQRATSQINQDLTKRQTALTDLKTQLLPNNSVQKHAKISNPKQDDQNAALMHDSEPVSFVDETLLKPHLELHFSGEKNLHTAPKYFCMLLYISLFFCFIFQHTIAQSEVATTTDSSRDTRNPSTDQSSLLDSLSEDSKGLGAQYNNYFGQNPTGNKPIINFAPDTGNKDQNRPVKKKSKHNAYVGNDYVQLSDGDET
ncbi:hypothetical protein RFI_16959, partial [Reticulomyxa filosa]